MDRLRVPAAAILDRHGDDLVAYAAEPVNTGATSPVLKDDMRYFSFVLLLLLAVVLFFSRGTALFLAGLQPLDQPAVHQLDKLSEAGDRSAKRFFDQRNELEVTVPRTMAAGEFLRLYLIDLPHVRRQIAVQEGLGQIDEETMLQEARVYRLTLTPPDQGAP